MLGEKRKRLYKLMCAFWTSGGSQLKSSMLIWNRKKKLLDRKDFKNEEFRWKIVMRTDQ